MLEQETTSGLLRGLACRLLYDAGSAEDEEIRQWMSRASSPGTPAMHAAAWLEGFLHSGGQALIHTPALWQMLDAWVSALSESAFLAALPLLRRAFSAFPPAERRQTRRTAAARRADTHRARTACPAPAPRPKSACARQPDFGRTRPMNRTDAPSTTSERLRRWRLILGSEAEDATGALISETDRAIDQTLALLYADSDPERKGRGGLGASAPGVARWLGDIRTYFPASVVQVMQKMPSNGSTCVNGCFSRNCWKR